MAGPVLIPTALIRMEVHKMHVKPLERVVENWVDVASRRGPAYSEGVQAPRRDWQQAAEAAKTNWADGVQEAITRDAYARGVRRAGTTRWQNMAQAKGVSRYPEGVRLSVDYYRTGWQPYHQTLERTTLPPRYPRRDPRNLERVRAVVEALIATKTAQGS